MSFSENLSQITESTNISDSVNLNESNSDSNNNSDNNNNYKNSPYNQPTYILPSNKESKMYIFENYLFKRSLLPINLNKEREFIIECTTCNYKTTEIITKFQTSNYGRHYKLKHPNIAYNKASEKN
jgi:hypothetical protein